MLVVVGYSAQYSLDPNKWKLTGKESRVSASLSGSGEFHSGETIGLGISLTSARSGSVSVVGEEGEPLFGEDLVVSIPVPTSIAAISA